MLDRDLKQRAVRPNYRLRDRVVSGNWNSLESCNPPAAYRVTSAPTHTLLTSYTHDQLNHLTQVSMPRNTVNGLVTQTRTFTV